LKLNKALLLNIFIALFISTLIVVLSEIGFMSRLELGSLDLYFRLRGPIKQNPHIVIVEIDDENILKIGRWPWDRKWHTALIRALKKLGAKTVYFDILFAEPASDEEDELFSQAIKESGNVYLPLVFQQQNNKIQKAFFPIHKLYSNIKGTGTINIHPDKDGVLRKVPVIFEYKNGLYYNIALKIAMDYAGLKFDRMENNRLVFSGLKDKVIVPVLNEKELLVNWVGPWQSTFKHYSFLDVINAYQEILEGKKPKLNIEPFRNSITLVGITAIGLYDINAIPIEPAYPAVGIMSTVVNNVLNNQFINTTPRWVNWLLIYILALIPSLLITGERALRETLLAISVGAIFIVADFLLFKRNIWIEPSAPLISIFASYLTINSYNFIRVSTEKKHFFKLAVTDGLTRLYNIRYFRVILRTECIMAKAEVGKQFCILMIDIDHFKHFNDTYGHQVGDLVLSEVSDVLRSTVRSSDVVARYGGEEMIILLRGPSLENGLNVAQEVRRNVEKHEIQNEGNAYKVTISIGVSNFKPMDNEDTIIKRADEGLYKAKNLGRNCVETVERSSFPEL
jgi:diguanylate cyclase (GGDEF)-like protein